ncbi:hypothetical protein QA612_10870 [Evansella sp. AB-P1]|uniref:hypothetical protein n=1 Tax=Evansella sp. AB-P1 TaxID=3037653 RepID=UPI00241D1FE2|nr:hypothetical protein [Evansella sp. AB-P1]MDG5787991.1 hypothetical protein [Evansella sp. AB-P1]
MEQQDELFRLYVNRLLKKHNVSAKKVELDDTEKERMRSIIENIQTEVQNYLDNTVKQVTEEDMGQDNDMVQEQNEEETENQSEANQSQTKVEYSEPTTKPKIYLKKNRKKRK